MADNTNMAAKAATANVLEKPESQIRVMWDTLKQNKAAVIGMIVIIILVLIALVDATTVFLQYLGNHVPALSGLANVRITPYDPVNGDMSQTFVRPSAAHWFGTDQLGRDIFSRVISGTKFSLSVGLCAVAFSLTIGVIVGSISGYFGGRTDSILMRIMDMMLSIPSMLLAITLMAAFGKGLDKAVIAIGFVSIPEYARIVRSSILSVKENDYIAAARVIGNNDWRIIIHHILPNVISSIVVRATLGISTAILDTSALGFLGLGVQPPAAEWGDMLGRARGYILQAPYTLIFPGLAITLAVLAFNLFGDGLRDALDPKARV